MQSKNLLMGSSSADILKAYSYDLLGGVWEDADAVKRGMGADMMIL